VFIAVVVIAVRRRESGNTRATGHRSCRSGRRCGRASSSGELLRAGAPYLAIVALVLVTRLVPRCATRCSRSRSTGGSSTTSPAASARSTTRACCCPSRSRSARRPGCDRERCPRRDRHDQPASRARGHGAAGDGDDRSGDVAVGHDRRTRASAAGVGSAWPLLAPAVGALGTFVTGSATASNILFTDFQVTTAEATGQPVLPLLGAQGFGAAVGNIICPHNIVAAAATVGLSGRRAWCSAGPCRSRWSTSRSAAGSRGWPRNEASRAGRAASPAGGRSAVGQPLVDVRHGDARERQQRGDPSLVGVNYISCQYGLEYWLRSATRHR
jgi:lactate permease